LETWVLLSLGAAFLQNLRSALQKTLTPRVGVPGAAYARFVFAAPWAVALVALLAGPGGMALPRPTPAFALWALAGAFGQIAGTLLLLRLFSLRNFAVGNTFAKTETVQAALLGLVLIGDRIGLLPLLAMLVSLTGILILSGSAGLGKGALNRAAGIGLLCGAAFAVSGVAYRGAGLALEGEAGFLMRAAVTLACVTVFQTVVMAPWVARRAFRGGATVAGGRPRGPRRHACLARLVRRAHPRTRGAREGGGTGRTRLRLDHRPPRLRRAAVPARDPRHRPRLRRDRGTGADGVRGVRR
jgi:drug/metabolite transporter (DMT)-like permease